MALALPEAVESQHWGNPSFRVAGRIFATVPDAGHLNVMIDAFDVDAVVRQETEACRELWWGKKLSGVQVDLQNASRALVGDLLEAAWRRRAPRRIAAIGSRPRPAEPARRRPRTARP